MPTQEEAITQVDIIHNDIATLKGILYSDFKVLMV